MNSKIFVLTGIILTFIVVGCGTDTAENLDQTPLIVETDTTKALTILYETAAQEMVVDFQHELKNKLLSAMNEGGPVSAIRYCSKDATLLGHDSLSVGWSIRRVTERYRNPDNRADTAEQALLARFADAANFVPYLSWWTEEDSMRTFHFYEPIRTNQFCLNCHGDVQTLSPGVFEALKKSYPTDRAIGYKAGQLRGLFVVEGKWPGGERYARSLVGDSI